MCFAFSPLPLKSSLCQIIVIFNIFLHIYYYEINLIIGIVYYSGACIGQQILFVDAKRVIGSPISKKGRQCNDQAKKRQNDKQWSTKNYSEN